jgi:gamma-glutamyltranspeptidase/glutathione hydrolase
MAEGGDLNVRTTWLKAARPVAGLAFASLLAGCSMLPGSGGSDMPLGATVTSGVETKSSRDDIAGKKMALLPSESSFAGAVIADEPAAALIARNILEKGGNAADAATALYFALSVTYPAAASLGGGGVCLAREGGKEPVETISFLTRRPVEGGAVAIPGNVRGFALLQARYGSLPWSQVVSPAERMAATGAQVSRSMARQLADNALLIGNSADLRRTFAHADGTAYGELDTITQSALAGTLARVRNRGVNGFYKGETARLLVAQSHAKGGALSASDLANYRPEVLPAQQIAAGQLTIMLPARSLGAGAFAAALWNNIQGASGAAALTAAGERTAVSLGARAGAALDGDYGSTSFVAVDGKGGAVACAVTMNGTFGATRVADGTGVVFAATPQATVQGLGSAFLVPVMVVKAKSSTGLYVAGAGSGAPRGGAAIENVVAAALTGADGAASSALASGPADARSPAHAIVCPEGLPAGACSLNVGPRGFGVGFGAVASGS